MNMTAYVVRVINIEGHYLSTKKRAHLLRKRKSETQYKGLLPVSQFVTDFWVLCFAQY